MKRAQPFFRKRILISIILPVLAVGIILSAIVVRYLTPPLFSFIEEKTESELRLASGLGLQILEGHMNYLMDLRLENDSEMITALKNESIGEIKAVSKKFHMVHLLVIEDSLKVLGSSIELPEEKLRLQTLPKSDAEIVKQKLGDERVRTHSLYFPFWQWHVVSCMYEKDYLIPVSLAKRLIYLGTFGVSIVVVLTLLIVFNWLITIPLQRIIDATDGAANGRLEKIEVKRNDEIGQVSIAYNSMAESINTIMSELRESENKFRKFADQSLVGINLIQDGVFKYVNPKFADIFGYTVEECLENMNFKELIYPGDLAIVEENVRRRMSGEVENVRYEFRGIKKTGEIINVEIFGSSSLYNGMPAVTATILDITERKKAEEALRISEDQIRLLLNSTVEAIYGVDLNGKCTFCNNGCLLMLGYENLDALIGKNMHHQIHHKHNDGTPYPEDECPMLQTIRKGKSAHADDEVLWKANGTCFPAEYWSYPQYRNGILTGAVVTFLDITERKRADEEIRKLAITDTMTGLYNRRGFIALAEQQIKNANRLFNTLVLFFIDVDGLKTVNDTMGHEEGDRLLINAAKILKQTFRESDIIARVGGDEFAVLAENKERTTQIVMNRFSERIRIHNAQPDRLYDISMSIGTTIYDPAIPCPLDDLILRADQKMYEQKKEKYYRENNGRGTDTEAIFPFKVIKGKK